MSDFGIKVTDLEKSMLKFWVNVFRGKARFRRATQSCDSSYLYKVQTNLNG